MTSKLTPTTMKEVGKAMQSLGIHTRFKSPDIKRESQQPPKKMEEKLEDWMRDSRFALLECAPSDHTYHSDAAGVPSGSFMTRVQKEREILASSLPRGIFVRAYEDRVDLLRCLIIGPEGTPFENAPFVFDVQLHPSGFPQGLLRVYHYAHGIRTSPNLYNNGTVCLSLLGTWRGSGVELWSATGSTLLQLFISLQSLVIVVQPYFTEPGYEAARKTSHGESASDAYSENTFLQTRSYIAKKLQTFPKGFEAEMRGIYLTGGMLAAAVDQLKNLVAESEAFPWNGTGPRTASRFGAGLRTMSRVGLWAAKRELAALEVILVNGV